MLLWNDRYASDLKLRVQSTKTPPGKLLKGRADLPEGLDTDFLKDLLCGKPLQVSHEIIDYLYNLCTSLKSPDSFKQRISRKLQTIPQNKRDLIISETNRTGIGIETLLKRAGVRHINPTTIRNISKGIHKKGVLANVDQVLALYALRPDKPEPSSKTIGDLRQEGLKPVSEAFLNHLKNEEARTGRKANSLVPYSHIVSNWKAGRTKTAEPAKMDEVLRKLAALKTK